ncbi:hypothetical protein SAMN05444507_11123 [Pseudomonas syringae]|nr:hypothetical protein SAMN05444507_11123 [Pseudomonas syringae]
MGLYGGYIERLAKKVKALLQDIEAIYNFNLGPTKIRPSVNLGSGSVRTWIERTTLRTG